MPNLIDPDDGTYVDRVTVVHHAILDDSTPAHEAIALVVDGGCRINRNELQRRVEELHFDHSAQGQPLHRPFILDERYHHYSRGADAATLALVVSVAANLIQGVAGNAIWDGLKAIGRSIRPRQSSKCPTEPLDGQLAIRRARQIIAASFNDVDIHELAVLSVAVVADQATVVLRGSDGGTFTVQPAVFDGGAAGPVTRTYPAAPPNYDDD